MWRALVNAPCAREKRDFWLTPPPLPMVRRKREREPPSRRPCHHAPDARDSRVRHRTWCVVADGWRTSASPSPLPFLFARAARRTPAAHSTFPSSPLSPPQIRFVLLVSRQGKVRLAKWYLPLPLKEKAKV